MVEVILPRLAEDIPMNIQQTTKMPPLRAHDSGYVSAQTWTGVTGWLLAGLQAVCGLVGAVAGDG